MYVNLGCKIRQLGHPKSSAICRAKKSCRKLGPQQYLFGKAWRKPVLDVGKQPTSKKPYHILARSVLQRETPAENRPRSEVFILLEHVAAVGDLSECFFFIWLNLNRQMAWLVGNS